MPTIQSNIFDNYTQHLLYVIAGFQKEWAYIKNNIPIRNNGIGGGWCN